MNARGIILLTGGAGFIGSHVAVEVAAAGWIPVLLDNFCTSERSVVGRISELVGGPVRCIEADIRDAQAMHAAFGSTPVHAVIHLAGLKAVGESVEQPELYHDNNVRGTEVLLTAMDEFGVRRMVFSSSCTVYGTPQRLPIDESHPLSAINPYGQTKLDIERMLDRWVDAGSERHVCSLRYFNPVGAHASALIGESPRGIPNNLMPYVVKVARGELSELGVFGGDWPTPDGTGIRDYIHVVDLARGHVAALERLDSMRHERINLGTGVGASVLEVVHAFERVNGVKVPYAMRPRRAGDAASAFADAGLAERRLGWRARLGLDEMMRDSWAFATRDDG
ncbi:MAG: UDP-glucose 4-epimerase GalE [Phycisphaerae bacterium]|nr:UDP-glucose 4-epimerase GalE [Phycisphaerae bacterium]